MALGKQVRYYRKRLNLTLEELAGRSGMKVAALSALENRDSGSSKHTMEVASALGLTVEQLLDETRDWIDEKGRAREGSAPIKSDQAPQAIASWPFSTVREDVLRSLKKEDRARAEGALLAVLSHLGINAKAEAAEAAVTSANDDEYAYIDRIDAKLSAGRGSIIYHAERRGRLSFRRDWLRAQGVNNPDNAVLADVDGESMAPTIPHGSTILIDLSQTEPVNGKVYAVFHDKEFYVKRLWTKTGITAAHSDNPDQGEYPPLPLVEEGDKIVGRVFWCGFGL